MSNKVEAAFHGATPSRCVKCGRTGTDGFLPPWAGRVECDDAAACEARFQAQPFVTVDAPPGCTCGYGGFHEPSNPRCDLAVLNGTAGPQYGDQYARSADQ